jgi:formylglycine-generating enzyme required for sulfatase activity
MVHLARLARAAVAALLAGGASARQCCDPDVSTYCTAGTTVHGCVPSIGGVGTPSAVASDGFDIVLSDAPTQKMGLIFYGLGAIPQPQPWALGSTSYLCIFYPVNRTGAQNSGGSTGSCDGELRVDFNAWRTANQNALGSPFTTGQVFHAQGWFRDPGAPKQTNLSNALRFVLGGCSVPASGLVPISAGTFVMGSDAASGPPYFGNSSTQPVHQVTISYCFWMGATEVTQAQYAALMGTNPSNFPGANRPVERVRWFDAQAYCAALSAQQGALGNVPPGYQYRLPTEAEWEYACRAGTASEFNVGSGLLCNQANFAYSFHSDSSCNSSSTAPVGGYAPNAWGLYDMHGSVEEWCVDSHAAYSAGAVTDPLVTGGPNRIIRGGSWSDGSYYCRSAYRNSASPSMSSSVYGFRVVLAPTLVP